MALFQNSVFALLLLLVSSNLEARLPDEGNSLEGAEYEDSNRGFAYSSYEKGPVCIPNEPIRYPSSQEEVINIVRETIRRNMTCKAVGALHSATDIVCTNGIAIDMKGIQGMRLNPDLSVSVGAGVNIRDLTDYLMTQGRALRGIAGFGNITVAGATGTGAHGSSIKHSSCISDQILSVLMVDGLGQVRTIEQDEDLLAFRVHLGLLGIILEIKFKTEPIFKVRAHNYVIGDEILTNGQAIKMAMETDQISLYWFPSMRKVVVANWTAVDVSTPGNAETSDHVPSSSTTWNFYSTFINEMAQRFDSLQTLNMAQAYSLPSLTRTVPDVFPIYSEDGYSVQNPAVGYYHRMFAPICNSTGWKQCPWLHGPNPFKILDNEIAVELSKMADLVGTVRDILSKSPAVFPIQGILLRFSEATKTYMSLNQGQKSVHFEFYVPKRKNPYEDASLGIAAYQAILQALVMKYNGRSHWGKSGAYYHQKDLLALKLDPTARRAFLNKMKEFDPNEIFMNDFGRRLQGVGTKSNIDPQTRHCALLDNCVCQKNNDCAANQKCSTIDGYPDFPVCKSPPRNQADNFLHPNPWSAKGIYTYAKHMTRLFGRMISQSARTVRNTGYN